MAGAGSRVTPEPPKGIGHEPPPPAPPEPGGGEGGKVTRAAEEGDRPVPPAPGRDVGGARPQIVAENPAGAGGDARGGGARPERSEERAVDAGAALVGHVREQVHDA